MLVGTLLFFVAMLAFATPSFAPDFISLRPGEAVTILIDDGGGATIAERRRAPAPAAFEKAAVRAYYDGFFKGVYGQNSKPFGTDDNFPEAARVTPGRIRLTFRALKRGHRLLVVENGYARALAYKAVMKVGKSWRTTDVCRVHPGVHNFEWWPEPVKTISVSRLQLVAWAEGQTPICE